MIGSHPQSSGTASEGEGKDSERGEDNACGVSINQVVKWFWTFPKYHMSCFNVLNPFHSDTFFDGNNLCIPFLWSLPTSLPWVHPQSAISQIILVNNRTILRCSTLTNVPNPLSSLLYHYQLALPSISLWGKEGVNTKTCIKFMICLVLMLLNLPPKFCYHSFLC